MSQWQAQREIWPVKSAPARYSASTSSFGLRSTSSLSGKCCGLTILKSIDRKDAPSLGSSKTGPTYDPPEERHSWGIDEVIGFLQTVLPLTFSTLIPMTPMTTETIGILIFRTIGHLYV